MAMRKLNIVFVCNGNSFRSQMAEGWGHALKGDRYNFYSAGVSPHGVNPKAVELMAQAEVDISQQYAKHVDELEIDIDVIFTLCGDSCPSFAKAQRVVKVDIPAPSKLAASAKSEAEAERCYGEVRDQVRRFVESIDQYLLE